MRTEWGIPASGPHSEKWEPVFGEKCASKQKARAIFRLIQNENRCSAGKSAAFRSLIRTVLVGFCLVIAAASATDVQPVNAQSVLKVFAERFGHDETARESRSRTVPGRDERYRPTSDEWEDAQPGRDRGRSVRRHEVESGETLFRIAKRYGVTVEALQRANSIDDPTTLRIGQSLLIPDDKDIGSQVQLDRDASEQPRGHRKDDWREEESRTKPRERADRESSFDEWRRSDEGYEPDQQRAPAWRERPQQERGSREPERSEAAPRARDAGGLRALARTMSEPAGGRDGEIPAGYIFFAQLVAADLKVGEMLRGWLDDKSRARRISAELDLDFIYGRGPEAEPDRFYIPYIRTGPPLSRSGKRYALSRAMPPAGNAFVVQLQASLIELHNRAVDLLIERHLASERSRYCNGDCSNAELARALPESKRRLLFDDARETVIHYYHRIIIEDLLPRLIGPERTQDIISNGRDLFFPKGFRDGDSDPVKDPFIPYEFALAAYQFTASQIRPSYVMREGQRPRRFDPAVLAANRPVRERLRDGDLADWRYFVDVLPDAPDGFNFARRIDPFVASSGGYSEQRRGSPNFAAGILMAGANARLPDGQQVAQKLLPELRRRGLLYLWQSPDSSQGDEDSIWRQYVLAPDRPTRETLGRGGTPLWYYVLQEAEAVGGPTEFGHSAHPYAQSVRTAARGGRDRRDNATAAEGGNTLGPVGGTIVGEVLIGLAEHYALKTGKGLGFQPPIGASAYGERLRFGLTRVRARGGELGERFLLRNLLIDAGAGVALD